MSAFYPHGKPAYYAYTEWFETVGHDSLRKAEANTKYPGLDGGVNRNVVIKALWNLRAMIDGARAAELAFLNATGMDIGDPNKSGDIFRTFNLIFNSRQTFERGLRYMKELSNVGKNGPAEQTYREVSRYFGSYLNSAIHDEMVNFMRGSRKGTKAAAVATMTADDLEQMINNIITRALTKTYERVYDFYGPDGKIRGQFGKEGKPGSKNRARQDEEKIQAITDMIPVIQDLGKHGAFKDFGDLFNLNRESLTEWLNGNITFLRQKGNKYNNAEVDSNYGGNALEVITSMVATEIGKTHIKNSGLEIIGKHTGRQNQMKADTLLFVGHGIVDPDEYLKYEVDTKTFDDKVRMQNIDALERYYNNLQDNVEHVIAISDKNYSITADFGGANAQEKMNLQNAGMMLSQFGVGQIPELITYLANCGPLMVQGAVDSDVRTELQSLIGYFLFDNLNIEIKGSRNVNVVNLINVSGMYIPLSVYLEGLYNSIQDAAGHPSSFVSVSISLGGPTEQNIWTPQTWGEFREARETESFISYRILKGIADFITGL